MRKALPDVSAVFLKAAFCPHAKKKETYYKKKRPTIGAKET
jgi:hypothetical protein